MALKQGLQPANVQDNDILRIAVLWFWRNINISLLDSGYFCQFTGSLLKCNLHFTIFSFALNHPEQNI